MCGGKVREKMHVLHSTLLSPNTGLLKFHRAKKHGGESLLTSLLPFPDNDLLEKLFGIGWLVSKPAAARIRGRVRSEP